MTSAVALDGVSRAFVVGGRRVDALREVSLAIAPGTLVGLVGPDGAGKTTLLRLLAGLLAPDSGSVRVLGFDLPAAAQAVQARVGYMPQRFGLYDDLSVRENLDLYADLAGLTGEERGRRLGEILHATELAPFQGRLARRLSGGMRQKLALGAVLLRSPPLLLLDEPSVGVDPLSRRELWTLARQLAGSETTVIWSTAYLDEAERCDRVLLLHEGRIVADGPPDTLRAEGEGHVFAIRPGDGGTRRLFRALQGASGVVDVSVRGGSLRVVTAAGALPTLPAETEVRPAAPRLEDAVVKRLVASAALSPHPPDPPPAPARSPDDGPVIRVRELVRAFGNFRAVDGLTFDVRRGEIFGLLGPNGAGKSTTFKMLCGLLPPSAGEATVLGHDLRTAAPRARARIGYMAQKFSLYGELSVARNLAFVAAAYGLPGSRGRARIAEVVRAFGLEEVLEQRSGDLPLGYRQRLAMAAALLHEPDILFLDEPTSGVDPLARRAFWYRITTLADAGTTVLVTTHFLDEAEYCDRVLIIDAGQALALGEPARIIAEAKAEDPSVADLEGAFVALLLARRQRSRAA